MNGKVWNIKDLTFPLSTEKTADQQNVTNLEEMQVNLHSIKGRELKLVQSESHSCKPKTSVNAFFVTSMCFFSL